MQIQPLVSMIQRIFGLPLVSTSLGRSSQTITISITAASAGSAGNEQLIKHEAVICCKPSAVIIFYRSCCGKSQPFAIDLPPFSGDPSNSAARNPTIVADNGNGRFICISQSAVRSAAGGERNRLKKKNAATKFISWADVPRALRLKKEVCAARRCFSSASHAPPGARRS
jgi:hypothetical protein